VRTRDPEDKRARVLAAARRLFAERGYAATTTADVAECAGVSQGILFHHFGSKEGLLAAVAGEYGRGLAEAMFPAGEPPERELASIEAALRRAFDFVREQGPLSRLLVLAADPTSHQTAHEATRAEVVAAIAGALGEAHERGLSRPMDPRIAAELLFALVGAALTECFVRLGGAREEEYLREAVRCVEGALLPRPELSENPEPRSRP
jgi:AcrR family transcriptional regulator